MKNQPYNARFDLDAEGSLYYRVRAKISDESLLQIISLSFQSYAFDQDGTVIG